MRIFKFCIPAVFLFTVAAAADVIGPHGEAPPHHFPSWTDKLAQFSSVTLSVNKTPLGSVLILVGENGLIADEARCAGGGPCRMTIRQEGALYLAPGRSPKGPVIDAKGLVTAHKLYFLRTFKIGEDLPAKLSCYLKKKGPSYIMECKP